MSAADAIAEVHARQVLDSRGNPTVEVDVRLSGGARGRALVPSGASTGTHEAVERRDGGDAWLGKGVTQAVAAVNDTLGPAVTGMDAGDQATVDALLCRTDGTPNKGELGANAILGVSLAVARAAAAAHDTPLYRWIGGVDARTLPVPLMNVLNGGAHADNALDVQEVMLVPVGAESFGEGLRMGVECFHHLRRILASDGRSVAVGDEGGFAPDLSGCAEAMEFLLQAVEAAGLEPGTDVCLALDVAAGELWDEADGTYSMPGEDKHDLSAADMIELYRAWTDEFPIVSIEDGLGEDDWDGWAELTAALGGDVQIVGDDLLVTHPERLRRGIEARAADSILVKVNQIGTLTETLETVRRAHHAGWTTVISHRSGETEDTTIADLAVATAAGQIKTGAPCRGERTAKYNRLLRIAEELGDDATYGDGALRP